MKQKPIMPKDHFDAIAAQLGNREEDLKAAARQVRESSILPNVHIIDYNSEYTNAESVQVLNSRGLRPITYSEALLYFSTNHKQKENLKGERIWVVQQSHLMPTGFYNFDEKGKLIRLDDTDPEKVVRVFTGNQLQLFLGIYHDRNPNSNISRFLLSSRIPRNLPTTLVGIKTD